MDTDDILHALDLALEGLLTARVALAPGQAPPVAFDAADEALRADHDYQLAKLDLAVVLDQVDKELGPSGVENLLAVEAAAHRLAVEGLRVGWDLGLTASRTLR